MRTLYIANLLVDAGLKQEQAKARALLVYSYMRVAPSLGNIADSGDLNKAQDMLLSGTNE